MNGKGRGVLRVNFVSLLSEILESTRQYLMPYFGSLNGFDNDKNIYCGTDQGLRPLGAEALLQSELYHRLRMKLPEPYIVSREFKPFSKSRNSKSLREGIDLAIFPNISIFQSRPSEAIVWLELKMTGGRKYLLNDYLSDFNKQLSIASLFHTQKRGLPDVIANIMFIESSKDYLTPEDPNTFLLGRSLPECMEAPSWFKKRFFEALLWREECNWELRQVFKENS